MNVLDGSSDPEPGSKTKYIKRRAHDMARFHKRCAVPVVGVIVAGILCGAAITSDRSAKAAAPAYSGSGRFVIDFSGYTGGPVEKWLQGQGYRFEKDAKNRKLLNLTMVREVRGKIAIQTLKAGAPLPLQHLATTARQRS